MSKAESKGQSKLSRWLLLIALASLASCFTLYVVMWWAAAADGKVPRMGENYGNHGPWNHYRVGIVYLEYIIEVSLLAIAASFLSLIFHPMTRTLIVLLMSIAVFLVILFGHFWLID